MSSIPGPPYDMEGAVTAMREIVHTMEGTHKAVCQMAFALGLGDLDALLDGHSGTRDFVSPSERWYVQFAGPQPGYYQGLKNVPNRLGSKVSIIRYKSKKSAVQAFTNALKSGKVLLITNGTERVMNENEFMN